MTPKEAVGTGPSGTDRQTDHPVGGSLGCLGSKGWIRAREGTHCLGIELRNRAVGCSVCRPGRTGQDLVGADFEVSPLDPCKEGGGALAFDNHLCVEREIFL